MRQGQGSASGTFLNDSPMYFEVGSLYWSSLAQRGHSQGCSTALGPSAGERGPDSGPPACVSSALLPTASPKLSSYVDYVLVVLGPFVCVRDPKSGPPAWVVSTLLSKSCPKLSSYI